MLQAGRTRVARRRRRSGDRSRRIPSDCAYLHHANRRHPVTEMFLKIEGIDGESLDRWHKNEIEIDNWSWTTKNNVTWGKNQGGHSTNAEISQITVNKICCRASAILYRYCVTGKHFKK